MPHWDALNGQRTPITLHVCGECSALSDQLCAAQLCLASTSNSGSHKQEVCRHDVLRRAQTALVRWLHDLSQQAPCILSRMPKVDNNNSRTVHEAFVFYHSLFFSLSSLIFLHLMYLGRRVKC